MQIQYTVGFVAGSFIKPGTKKVGADDFLQDVRSLTVRKAIRTEQIRERKAAFGALACTCSEVMNFTGIAFFEGLGFIPVLLDTGGEIPPDMRLCADC